MASIEELERQLAELDQAFQTGQIDEASYQQHHAHISRMISEAQPSIAPAGSDFFATGGGAPPTASGVVLNQGAGQSLGMGQVVRGRYRVGGVIGEGGMGIVYRVHDQLRNRELAMKLLHPNFPAEAQSQLASELSMQERIRDKGVVRTYDLDVEPESGRFFYTMELVDGPSLEDVLDQAKQERRVPPMPMERITDLMQQLSSVLHTAHQEGIVHRDLKPQNILLPQTGGLKLLDFGIAKDLSEQSQHTGFTGTPIYMAPEQLRGGGTVTPAADIYSIGVILYQLLTGQLFYGRMPGPSEWLTDEGLTPSFPNRLDDVVFKALDFSPARRYQSTPEFMDAYLAALGSPVQARMPSHSSSSPSRSKSWSEAADASHQAERPVPIEEPEAPVRSLSNLKGRPVVRGSAAERSIRVSTKDSGRSKKSRLPERKKKKGKGIVWKILLFIFVGLPFGLGLLGWLLSSLFGEKGRRRTPIPPVVVNRNVPIPPPLIDLQQVNEAFQKTRIPSKIRSSRSNYKKHKGWMFVFERTINEIYTGNELVSLYAKRVKKRVTIFGFINVSRLYGYQARTDTLLFKIVQLNVVAKSYSEILRNKINKRTQRTRQATGGNWLERSYQKKKSPVLQRSAPVASTMRYRIEDGMGWVYRKTNLPSSSDYNTFAQSPFNFFYFTKASRHIPIITYRRAYRNLSFYRTRQTRHSAFVTSVRSRRSSHYRRHPVRSRSRSRSRSGYRSRSRSRSGYRRSGGKW